MGICETAHAQTRVISASMLNSPLYLDYVDFLFPKCAGTVLQIGLAYAVCLNWFFIKHNENS